MKSILPAFTETHAALLRDFLTSPQRVKGTMTYPQLAGFLFSMANGPELIPPSEWMPIVFNDQNARYETQDEAEGILQAMIALYNDCGQERAKGSAFLPPGCEIKTKPLDNLGADAPLSQWARGFLAGHIYLEEIWDDYIPDELDEKLGSSRWFSRSSPPQRSRRPTTRRARGSRAWNTSPKRWSWSSPTRWPSMPTWAAASSKCGAKRVISTESRRIARRSAETTLARAAAGKSPRSAAARYK
jgi:yecA family protein